MAKVSKAKTAKNRSVLKAYEALDSQLELMTDGTKELLTAKSVTELLKLKSATVSKASDNIKVLTEFLTGAEMLDQQSKAQKKPRAAAKPKQDKPKQEIPNE